MSFTDQQCYQVRSDWALAGLNRLAHADVVVVVDALCGPHVDDASVASLEIAAEAASRGSIVLAGGLSNAAVVANRILEIQHERAERTFINVVAVGKTEQDGLRFAVEDHLAAGAIIAALGDLGIDHTSPDAAVCAEAYRALSHATTHLVLASATGREVVAVHGRARVSAAATPNPAAKVPVFAEGIFVV